MRTGSIRRLAVLIMAPFALASCTVQLISSYDEQTDAAATALQKDLSAYFVRIGSATTPEERAFKANLDFYRKAVVDFGALEVRARAKYKNDITIEQIDLTQTNLAWLVLLHKGCVSGPLSDAQRASVVNNGVDLSLDCRISYGASMDASDRGDQRLSPAVARITQRQFDQQLGAIIALELAKKRGKD